jgi:hypothetical protein
MLNRTYFFSAFLVLSLSGCSNTNVDRRGNYCTNSALDLPSTQPNWEGHPQYPHPSNDPVAKGAGDVSMGSDCYLGSEELDDLDL